MITAQELCDYKTPEGRKKRLIEEVEGFAQKLEKKAKQEAQHTNMGYVDESTFCEKSMVAWFYGNALRGLADELESLGYAVLIYQELVQSEMTTYRVLMFWDLTHYKSVKADMDKSYMLLYATNND